MTRDTYDVTIRRASQLSDKLELFRRSSPTGSRRPSKVTALMAKRSLLREDFRGSDRTLVSSSLDSNTSSRSNVHTLASSSYYTNSNNDVRGDDRTDDEDEEEDEDDDDGGRGKPDELESDRGVWERTSHYVLLGFGAVFGVRNILKFPALAIEHGGGAFVFTYVFLTFTVGVPIVYLEVSLGQYARGGVVKAWRMIPLTKGIGVCSLLLTIARTSYSSTPAAWALYYFYSAMSKTLPFKKDNYVPAQNDVGGPNTTVNLTSNYTATLHKASYGRFNKSFFTSTLEITDSISNMGHVVPHVITSLLVIWIIVFLLSAIGPRLLGKIAMFFTAVPSVLLVILLIAACTMSGSVLGIQTFLSPKWHSLSSVKPWLDAFDLVLSSLACGTGVLVTLSGHCSFHGNTFRNAMSMTVLSLLMTIVSGCLLLSLLGVESKLLGVRMDTMPRLTDVDLGFVMFPAVTSNLPAPAIWSCIFFLAIVLFSLVQAAVMVHHIQQGLVDIVYLQEIKLRWRVAILGTITVIMMSFNVLTTTENGLYVLRLLQFSVPRLSAPLLGVAECLTVGWGYGARRFAGRITEMTGRNKSFVWKWLWRWGCPVVLSIVSIASILTTNLLQDLPPVDMDQKWIHAVGWSLSPIILFPGLVMATVSFCGVHGTFKQRLKQLRSTPSSWGPGHPEHEPQADLPDYVICHPDPFRPANALAMLTANLYLPNIVNFVNMQPTAGDADMGPDYLSDMATLTSSDDDDSLDSPISKDSCLGRCHATVPCLSHVIGLGNVVRFPYLAYRHGGGAFIIAYVIVLITVGIPLIIIETAVGQFSSLGPISVWRAVPIGKGIGFSMVLISLLTTIYYSAVTSWSMFYLATSLTSVMPWKGCENSWNTNSCAPVLGNFASCHKLTNLTNLTATNPGIYRVCEDEQDAVSGGCVKDNTSVTSLCQVNTTDASTSLENSSMRSAEEYFYLSVVKQSEGLHQVGELRWQICLCLLTTWAVVIVFLVKGFKPGGKTTYLFLTLTFITLVILLVRSSSLIGGHDGLSFLFTLQWSKLMEGQVWRDATSQVFFSMSLGCGSLVAMGTYNKFSNNVIREAALLCIIDTGMSLLCSLVVFAVIGTIAHTTGTDIQQAARADIGLSFVTLSKATLMLPWPLFWAILTFTVMVLSGILTCVATMTTAVTSLMDFYSSSFKKHKTWLVLAVCAAEAFLGLPMMFQVGFHIVSIMDTYLSGLPQLFIGGATVVAFAWIYGIGRLCTDISRMLNAPIGWWWRLIWAVVCPSLIAMLVVSSVVSVLSKDEQLKYPWWVKVIGLIFWLLLLVPIILGGFHEVSQTKSGGFVERLRKSCQPRKEWGATLHRCNSNVEYYPTVHTHLGIDISREGLNTVADHVEFTTVGVRVPSLSQTTLLPVSPGTPRGKRPMDMRHKAILNHAYSNPQCHLSSGSLEKLGKKSRVPMSLPSEELQDVIVIRRPKHKQPIVNVTKRKPALMRSSSWHQLGGQPAILKVNTQQLNNTKTKVTTPPKHQETIAQRRRRYGQSKAPNLRLLIGRDEGQLEPRTTNYELPCAITLTNEALQAPVRACGVLIDSSESSTLPRSPRVKTLATSVGPVTPPPINPQGGSAATATTAATAKTKILVSSHSQSDMYRPKRPGLENYGSTRDGRSKSVEETSVCIQNIIPKTLTLNITTDGASRNSLNRADIVSAKSRRQKIAATRTKSESEKFALMRSTRKNSLSSRPLKMLSNNGHCRSKSFSSKGGNVIMEEELDPEMEEIRDDFRACLQMIHAENEMSKL